MACCPFHNEKTPSFTVSEAKQFFYCFGCHAKGNVIGFLMDYEHLGYVDAIEALAADLNLEVPHEDGDKFRKSQDDKRPLYDTLEQAGKIYQQELKRSQRAIDYLKQRGLSGEIARRFGIGYAPDAWDTLLKTATSKEAIDRLKKTGMIITSDKGKTYDRFRDRIMFPITDQRGHVIGFGGRIIDNGEPKYLNSPENSVFHKGYELYGLYEAKQALRQIDRIMVVEGYMDVVALAQNGIDYAVASLGTATTSDQIQKILRTSHEIVFCYDGDNAGKKAAWRALENSLPLLRDGHVFRFLFLPEGEDPDTMVRKEGKQAFEQRISNAMTLSDFMFDTLKAEVDTDTREGKAQLASRANALIDKMHNSLFKDLLLEELSSIVGLSQQTLESKLTDNIPSPPPATGPQTTTASHAHDPRARIAVALLVQNPQLAIQYPAPEAFSGSSNRGLNLLYTLQQTITDNPEMTSAALLERYRGTEHEGALLKLSMLSTPETENTDSILGTYSDLVRRLHIDDRYTYLQTKMESSRLSQEELEEYSRIIRNR
jgi:DNA primase